MTKRALIRTLPLENRNYGGVLQAYCLQEAIQSLGWEAVVDVTGRVPHKRQPLRFAKKLKGALLPIPLLRYEQYELASREIARFVNERINGVELFGVRRTPRAGILDSVDAIVVGSDQVWRSAYGDVSSFALDFLPPESTVRRLSYAASFGDAPSSDDAVYTALRPYFSRFDLLSVREPDGVRATKELWGMEAHWVLDPVALHKRSFFERLSGRAVDSNGIFSYLLDPSDTKLAKLRALQTQAGVERVRTVHAVPPPRFGRAEARPSLEDWVRGFIEAEVVHTDSFHGAVMALILNKPLMVHINVARGAQRFASLFAATGLSEVERAQAEAGRLINPDWDVVNSQLSAFRQRSMAILRAGLGV